MKQLLIFCILCISFSACVKEEGGIFRKKKEISLSQKRLNSGETPIELFNSDATLLKDIIGSKYAGGYIIYLDTITGKGITAYDKAWPNTLNWGCKSTNINGTKTSVGSGLENTIKIVAKCPSKNVAIACYNFTNKYNDWYLPSIKELELIYKNLILKHVETEYKKSGSIAYYSSSEQSSTSAHIYYFRDAGNWVLSKNIHANFIPVRSF